VNATVNKPLSVMGGNKRRQGEAQCERTFTALDGSEWIALCHSCFIARERAPGMHCRGGCVGPRGGVDAVEKISCPCLESNPDSSV
jgi:hypothetical protein